MHWAPPGSRLQASTRDSQSLPRRDFFLEILQAVHQPHIGADPPALRLGRVVSIVDGQVGILIQPVGNDQAGRSAGTLLAVDQNLLAVLCPPFDCFAEPHEILANIGVVIPGNVNILWLLERLGPGGRRRVS